VVYLYTLCELPSRQYIHGTFKEICKKLEVEPSRENMERLVVYEMTDGMRTTTKLTGADSYFDGAIFVLRFGHILKELGSKCLYTNVVEEKHAQRKNWPVILEALKRCPRIYEDYAKENDTKMVFLGDYHKIDPSGELGKEIDKLMEKTANNKSFTSVYLLGYSPEWAELNRELWEDLPEITVTIRHAKLRFSTGMQLPPEKSENTEFVYVQQGSANSTWSDYQKVCLAGIALRSMLINELGTQYWKEYTKEEAETVRKLREEMLYYRRFYLFKPHRYAGFTSYPPGTKRAIIGSPFGPEEILF
jgi:hypothetical protein